MRHVSLLLVPLRGWKTFVATIRVRRLRSSVWRKDAIWCTLQADTEPRSFQRPDTFESKPLLHFVKSFPGVGMRNVVNREVDWGKCEQRLGSGKRSPNIAFRNPVNFHHYIRIRSVVKLKNFILYSAGHVTNCFILHINRLAKIYRNVREHTGDAWRKWQQ